jgi:HAD domain in Swiss Army Knife RNA repair proteins
MTSPILFLDIDGVMNTTASCLRNRSGLVFTRSAVEALGEIVQTSDCRIVISSTRRSAGLGALKDNFENNHMADISKRIVAATPRFTDFDTDDWREDEIAAWLADFHVTEKYAILDDKPFTGPLRRRLVLTDHDHGLLPAMVPEVLANLNR